MDARICRRKKILFVEFKCITYKIFRESVVSHTLFECVGNATRRHVPKRHVPCGNGDDDSIVFFVVSFLWLLGIARHISEAGATVHFKYHLSYCIKTIRASSIVSSHSYIVHTSEQRVGPDQWLPAGFQGGRASRCPCLHQYASRSVLSRGQVGPHACFFCVSARERARVRVCSLQACDDAFDIV